MPTGAISDGGVCVAAAMESSQTHPHRARRCPHLAAMRFDKLTAVATESRTVHIHALDIFAAVKFLKEIRFINFQTRSPYREPSPMPPSPSAAADPNCPHRYT